MTSDYTSMNSEIDDEPDSWPAGFKKRKNSITPWPVLIILDLVITSITAIAYFSSTGNAKSEPMPADYAQQNAITLETTWNRFWWNTEYSPKNHNDNDALWNSILPSHGFVAVEEGWAFEQHWPDSMRLPSNSSKRVYLLEAYHQLHCLRIIQKTFWEAVEGRPYTWHPSMHMTHCFDAIRQSIQCQADSTPLYTFGDFTVGDGQLHKCRSWNQLRDFATAHTACYKDSVDPIPLGEHFGFCDNGSDGLP